MNIVRGAGALLAATEVVERKKINWFSLTAGKSKNIRFLQEIDFEADGYNEEADVGALVTIHNPPGTEGFKYKYLVPDEMLGDLPEGWSPKKRLYINVLVIKDNGDMEAQLWDASKRTARSIIEASGMYGGLTKRMFKVTRHGGGTDTQYIVQAHDPDGGVSVTPYLDEIIRPEDILTELTAEKLATHPADVDSDSDGDSGSWTA